MRGGSAGNWDHMALEPVLDECPSQHLARGNGQHWTYGFDEAEKMVVHGPKHSWSWLSIPSKTSGTMAPSLLLPCNQHTYGHATILKCVLITSSHTAVTSSPMTSLTPTVPTGNQSPVPRRCLLRALRVTPGSTVTEKSSRLSSAMASMRLRSKQTPPWHRGTQGSGHVQAPRAPGGSEGPGQPIPARH